jgi:hypothetical protein
MKEQLGRALIAATPRTHFGSVKPIYAAGLAGSDGAKRVTSVAVVGVVANIGWA